MRINIYAEELPFNEEPGLRRVQVVTTTVADGGTFFGVRIFLQSPESLHDTANDDDRSAVTFWGPSDLVAALLRDAADAMSMDKPGE